MEQKSTTISNQDVQSIQQDVEKVLEPNLEPHPTDRTNRRACNRRSVLYLKAVEYLESEHSLR